MLSKSIANLHTQLRTKNAAPPLIALSIGYAYTDPSTYQNIILLTGSICIVLLVFFAHLQNDVADYAIDAQAKRKSPLVQRRLNINETKNWAYIFLASAILIAIITQSRTLVIAALIYAALIWTYNMRPIQGSRRPILSIVLLGLLYGGLPSLFGAYIQFSAVSWSVAALVIGMFVYRVSISILKDYKDYDGDKAFQKHTFLIKFGAAKVRAVSVVCSIIGYSIFLTCVGLKIGDLWSWMILAALIVLAVRAIKSRTKLGLDKTSFQNNNKIFQSIFETAIYFDMGVLLCLYIS